MPAVHDHEDEPDRHGAEAAGIAAAMAELDAGLYVDADDVDAWIDSIGTGHELPPPPTRKRNAFTPPAPPGTANTPAGPCGC